MQRRPGWFTRPSAGCSAWNRRGEQAPAGSKTHGRREAAFADPHRITEQQAPSPHGPVEARDLLAQLRLLRPREAIVLLVGEGEQASQVARILKMPVDAAFSRLRLGRKHLAHVLKRWRRLR